MRYEDFVIQLGPDDGDGHPVQVLKSPAGEGTGRFHPPIDQEQMQRLWHDQERVLHERGASREAVPPLPTRDARPSSPGKSEAKLGAVGIQLFDTLFSGQVRRLYDHSQGAIGASPEVGLRIKLKLDPGEPSLAPLYGLPWEFLYQTETDDALCLSRRTPLVRYLDVPRPVKPIPLPAVLRILVVMSSPAGLPPLDLERERALIEEAWGQHPEIEVVFLPRATSGALRQALLEDPVHVLHFMGHGGFDARADEGVLFLEGDDGSAHPIGGRALAAKLKDFDSLGLVFLNACKTARVPAGSSVHPFSGVSSALVLGGVPAVVAMQFPISDRAAIKFSEGFYRRLAQGDSVDEAVTEGRQSIHSADSGSMEWGTPVLFVRVPDGTVFERPEAAPKRDVKAKWINAGASILTLLLLTVVLVVSGVFRDSPASVSQDLLAGNRTLPVEIGHVFTTSVEGLDGRLIDIDPLPNGRMRLNFEFKNTTDRELDLDFFNGRTYLADDSGNRYGVVPAEEEGAGLETNTERKVPAAGTSRYSLDFPAPQKGAEILNVGLEPTHGEEGARPEFFQIDIADKVPEEFLQAPEPIEKIDGAQIRELEDVVLTSNVEGFDGKVAQVALLDEKIMRWSLEFFNRSGEDQTLGLRYDQIYLADEYGNRYPVLRSSQHINGKPVNAFEGPVQRAVRLDQWLEFPAPIEGAKQFVLHLAGTAGSLLSFKGHELRIPKYDTKRYSQTTPPSPMPPVLMTWEVGEKIGNSLRGFESRLESVLLLKNGRTRWNLRLFNRSRGDLKVGLNHKATYLADNTGHPYEVAATSTVAAPNQIVEILLQPGLREDVWLEFPTPREGASSFKLRLVSHDEQRLVYSVTELGALTYPDAFEPAPPATRSYAPSSQVLALDQGLETAIGGLEARLSAVELMESGRMRWYLDLFNRGSGDLRMLFDSERSRLRDPAGNEYLALSADTGDSNPLRGFLRASARLDFANPRDGAQKLSADLAVHVEGESVLVPFEVDLPEYDPRYTEVTATAAPDIPSFVLQEGETPIGSDISGLEAKLTRVERLDNGRLRWHVEIFNGTGAPLEVGFNHEATYLSDNRGNEYRVLASDTNPRPDEVRKPYRESLDPGQSTRHWFEFSGPSHGASRFMFVLGSHDTATLRFRPVQRDLSKP